MLANRPASLSPEIGIGDDAAVWLPTPGRRAIETTDLLIEEVHFSLRWASWYDVGWKAMAVNISDVAAMGGVPKAAFVSAGLRADIAEQDALQLYAGLADCAAEYDVAILGGDTVASPQAAVVNVAIFGESVDNSGAVLRRDRAAPGQAIGVSGPLGGSAACLRLMEHGGPPSGALREAHVRPRPQVALGQALLRAGVRCAMDISDGLAGDLGKICAASGVAAVVELARVPVAPDAQQALPAEALDLAVTGGEDYELLACGPTETLERVGLTIIGEIVAGQGSRFLAADGRERHFDRAGYDAFLPSRT